MSITGQNVKSNRSHSSWDSEALSQATQNILQSIQDKSQRDLVTAFLETHVRKFLTELASYCDGIIAGKVSIEKGQVEIGRLFDQIADRGNEIETALQDRLLILEVKKTFRHLTGAYVYQSHIIKLAHEKPRGYPGDYEMLELIYNNIPITDGVGRFLDRYFLDNGYAESVRKRKEKMRLLLAEYIKQFSFLPVRVLNIACGSCREIRELCLNDRALVRKLDLTILDQDSGALKFSKTELESTQVIPKLKCVQVDVLALIRDAKQSISDLGNQHLIYTIGLADYFPDRIFSKFVSLCFNLLATSGRCVIAHKDREADEHAPLLPDWFCDWKFHPRNERKVYDLIQKVAPEASIGVDRDNSGRILFYTIIKA